MSDQTESASEDILRALDAAGKFDTAWGQFSKFVAEHLRALEAKVRELEEQRDTAMTDRHDEMMDLRADRDRLARENEARWRDVAHEVPEEAQEVLMVRDGKTIHGAWIGESFWHSNQKVVAAYWMPLPKPIVGWTLDAARRAGGE